MSINQDYIDCPPFVGLLQFETSTACDGKCTFCNHHIMKRCGSASWSTILEVIDTCAPFASTACPFLMGEPLLEPRLTTILDNLKQVNPKIQTHIYSNMHSLTAEKTREIVDSQLLDLLTVSFYGATPDLYSKYQPGFDYHRTRENIKQFMAYRNSRGLKKPQVQMHFIALPDLLRHYTQFEKEWSSYADNVGITVYRTHNQQEQTEAERWEQLIHGKHAPLRVPCSRIWSGFYVHFNGDVVPCSADYNGENVLGNIHECYRPMDIWWGAKAKAFRQKHINQQWDSIPMCRNCNYWKYEMPKDWVKYWLNYYGGKNIVETSLLLATTQH